ncbi:MAG: L-serine ammonia-lyase, partial [Ancylobacter novellus]
MISVFELFKIGIGPSSSHTVGPMVAAASFIHDLAASDALARTARVETVLYGSLAWTGKGHGTDKAVILGLAGQRPQTLDPDHADALVAEAGRQRRLFLAERHGVPFDAERDILFDGVSATPKHPNTLAFRAIDAEGGLIVEERWCSIGGGFVVREEAVGQPAPPDAVALPYPFRNARELLALADGAGISIAELVLANEQARRPAEEVTAHLDAIVDAMMSCVDRGIATAGELPGGLKVRRRAKAIHDTLLTRNARTPHEVMDWVSLYAIAVNEENAAGGRVVTAPTNGAAGVVPATLRYYL